MENKPENQRNKDRYYEYWDEDTEEYIIRRKSPLPSLARDYLEKLSEVGLHNKWRCEDDAMHPVHLKENGDTFWLMFDRRIDDQDSHHRRLRWAIHWR
jgi:hypothetical protein